MNWNRVLLGGAVAAVFTFVFAGIAGFLGTAHIYTAMMQRLHLTMSFTIGVIAWDVAASLISGMFIAFLYAAFRPRFGAGPKTALLAGVSSWLGVNFISVGYQVDLGMLPLRDGVILSAQGLVMCLLAAQIAGAMYREKDAASAASA